MPKPIPHAGRRSLARLASILFACVVALALVGVAAADSFTPVGGGWQVYVNDRFGTRIELPDSFAPGEPPENGDGQSFSTAEATLSVFAFNNMDNETASSLRKRLAGTPEYANITYNPAGSNWLVLSGYRGDRIFYEKYLFRGDVVHGFVLEFPKSEKPRYAPIIERMENSFRAGP